MLQLAFPNYLNKNFSTFCHSGNFLKNIYLFFDFSIPEIKIKMPWNSSYNWGVKKNQQMGTN